VCLLQAKALLSAARDAGVNFFDNAEVYAKGQAEEIMGKAFKVRHPHFHGCWVEVFRV
jgi:aryl-alcohol dehydrogenase-like predicted oxidoreductase